METAAHRALKFFACALLHQQGCRALATEVRCPIGRFRIDVAGWQDIQMPPNWGRRGEGEEQAYPRRCEPRTLFVECKQSRADFLRDRKALSDLLAQREVLLRRKRELEENVLKVQEPALRSSGESLFPAMETWNFAEARSPQYHDVLAAIGKVERQLTGTTKFWYLAHHRLADAMLIAAPQGMISPDELPTGWGLAECPPDLLASPARRFTDWPRLERAITVPAPAHGASPQHRLRVLRNIAVAATFAAMRSQRFTAQRVSPTPKDATPAMALMESAASHDRHARHGDRSQ